MAERESLPIFPLPNVVLFPRVKTPLHLFEPRYRQLAQAVVDGDRRMAMGVVRPEHVDDMEGDPPIYPIACVGVVTEAQRMADGRYNLVLLGQTRVRVVEEEPPAGERLYRVALVEALEDTYDDDERESVAALRRQIVEDVGVLVRHTQPERSNAFDPELFAGVDDETFVNAIANSFAFAPPEKQSMLEANSIPERFACLAGVLSFQRMAREQGALGGRPSIH